MVTRIRALPRTAEWQGPAPEQRPHRVYSVAEDKEHTNVHYEQPPEFFTLITGGEWNVYSCNLWRAATTMTEAQEAKLDLMANYMQLKPGARILDVGCGWGGPLTYLSKRYGVEGVGLTLSATQKRAAEERIARYGVPVTIHECHWQEYEDARPFDAIYTDEVIVHFNDLGGFFRKAHSLLRDGGRLVNKELHFTTSRYKNLTRADVFVNEIYGLTANYRTLGEELTLLDQAGFSLETIHQFSQTDYQQTAGGWLANMRTHKARLIELVGEEHYRNFRAYLMIVMRIFTRPQMSLDINVVVASKA